MHYRQRMLTYVDHCNNLVMKRSSQDIDVNSVVIQYEVHDAVCQRTAQPSGRRCRSWQLRTVGLLRPLSSPHKPHQSLSTSTHGSISPLSQLWLDLNIFSQLSQFSRNTPRKPEEIVEARFQMPPTVSNHWIPKTAPYGCPANISNARDWQRFQKKGDV